MNYRILFKIIGAGMLITAAFMLVPFIIALSEKSGDSTAFLITIIICAAVGLALALIKNTRPLRARDSIVGVILCWVAISLAGSLPFYLSGVIPSFVDSFFEAVSGFSTTGATILTDVEALPLSLLMWRSLMHWIGGMGVIVFVLILSERMGSVNSVHLMSVESTGPEKGKLLPSAAKTAKALYLIYAGFTFLEALLLIIAGMPVYDAFLHAFSTAGTGGFSMMNSSIAAYNSLPIDVIITVFMLLFGVSFTLHYQLINRNFKAAVKSTEFKAYLIIVGVVITVIAFNIAALYDYDMGKAFRYSAFQAASVASTTGFGTADFTLWPALSQWLLICLMVVGGMAGSTGGGVKYARLVIAAKALRRDLKRSLHPNLVEVVKMDGRAVSETTVSRVMIFIVSYIMLITVGTIIVSLDGFDFATNITSVLSAVSNIGPGLSLVGPAGNYSIFSDLSKVTLSVCMIAGRLEIFPFLLLFAPRTWRM